MPGWWISLGQQGLGFLALGYALLANGDPLRRILIAIMAGGWSFRLATYLLINRVIGKPEDGRYQRLREHWRQHTQLKFFGFFQAQALLTAVFAAPFLVVALTRNGRRWRLFSLLC
jgi:steroid 5-alpha reductase family enzyme